MARKKSPLVSEHGKAHEILERLSWAVHDAGGEEDDLREALAFEPFRERIGCMVVAHGKLFFAGVEHQVMNLGMSEAYLAQRLGLDGDFFQSSNCGWQVGREQTYVVVQVRMPMSRADASRHLRAFGYRFATIQEAFTNLNERWLHMDAAKDFLPIELARRYFGIQGYGPCWLRIEMSEASVPAKPALLVVPEPEIEPWLQPSDYLIAVRLA